MRREKATAHEDLPHRFEDATDGHCSVCQTLPLDARHVAWERERADLHSDSPSLARELGT